VSFKDITEIIEPLELPMGGKSYRIRPLGALDGARLAEHLADREGNPMSDEEFQRLMLGPAYDDMLSDGLPSTYIVRAALTALADHQASRAVAEVMWETGGDPKALTVWSDQVRQAMAVTTPRGAATTTKRRASGSGTKTSRKN
jgi:hypothetical protein